MYADDTHITYAGSDLHLIQSRLSYDLEKQMVCVLQAYLEHYKNWIYVDRLHAKIKYLIWYTRTVHW